MRSRHIDITTEKLCNSHPKTHAHLLSIANNKIRRADLTGTDRAYIKSVTDFTIQDYLKFCSRRANVGLTYHELHRLVELYVSETCDLDLWLE